MRSRSERRTMAVGLFVAMLAPITVYARMGAAEERAQRILQESKPVVDTVAAELAAELRSRGEISPRARCAAARSLPFFAAQADDLYTYRQNQDPLTHLDASEVLVGLECDRQLLRQFLAISIDQTWNRMSSEGPATLESLLKLRAIDSAASGLKEDAYFGIHIRGIEELFLGKTGFDGRLSMAPLSANPRYDLKSGKWQDAAPLLEKIGRRAP